MLSPLLPHSILQIMGQLLTGYRVKTVHVGKTPNAPSGQYRGRNYLLFGQRYRPYD